MKIALFSDTYAPDINGVATSTKILRNALIEKGHDVLIVTSELPSDSDYIDSPTDNILRVPGVEVSKLYGYRACKLYSFKGMKEIKQYGIQLIHCQTEFGVGIFSRLVSQSLDIPIVYTYHTMWADYSHYLLPIKSNKIDGLLKKMIQRFSAINSSICTELIVPSSKTAEALKEYGLKKDVNIIPTGLELNRFNPKNKHNERIHDIIKQYGLENKFVITFLGRIGKEKSIDVIIDAVTNLKSSKEFVVMIVGGGPNLSDLQNYAIEKGVHNIYFTGPKEPVFVPDYYHVSDVFVSASLSETQGLTFIEAMATGTPVLARYDKNLEDVIKDGYNGFFFDDVKGLTEKLLYMIENDISHLAKNAYDDAMSHSSELFCNRILEVYQRALLNKKYIYEVDDFLYTKNNKIDLILSYEDTKIKIEVTELIIEEHDLFRGKAIDREVFDILKQNELISLAYSNALKLLSKRDYTENQLKKKILNNGEFEHNQIDKAIDILKEKNLIDDYQYSLDYMRKCLRIGVGLNKSAYKLNNLDVSKEIINACILEIEEDEEYNSIIEVIEKMISKNKTFSHRMIISRINQKLYSKGYRNDIIMKAMQAYDFVYDSDMEKQTLSKDFEKSVNKYRRKVNNKDLQRKIIDVLLKKGYNYEDISELVIELEEINVD